MTRKEYLTELAEDYGIPVRTVFYLADILGPNEDEDGLINALEDLADEIDECEWDDDDKQIKGEQKMAESVERPAFVEREHLVYLDELRESDVTNMFDAQPYLLMEFPELSEKEAVSVLVYWMNTFGDRHGK